jgi:type IVB pilus formation R64 PilN family outer membrane protein
MNRLNRKFSPIALAGLCLVTTACSTNRINAGTEQLKIQTEPMVAKAIGQGGLPVTPTTIGTATQADDAAAALNKPVVAKRSAASWIGAKTMPVLSDSALPPIFREAFAIEFDGYRGGRVPIAVVAERLSRMTGIPVRVKQDVYSGGGARPSTINAPQSNSQIRVGASIPATLPPASGPARAGTPSGAIANFNSNASAEGVTDIDAVAMRWQGSLDRYLDHVTGLLNLSWSYREGVVVIERFVTESFEITAFGGTQDYKMSISGGNSGASGSTGFGSANASLDVNEAGKLTALEGLKKTLDALVTPTGGSVTLNESSGRFTVVSTKDVLSKVREIIRAEDTALRRQVNVQFDVYSVTSNTQDEYGVDWTGFMTDLAKTWSGKLTAPASLVSTSASGLSYTLLKDPDEANTQSVKNTAARYGGSKALLQALHQMGDSAQYRPVSILAMNRQWARKTNLRTTGYVSETTPSTSSAAGSGAPGLKTSTVSTGDKFLVQPAIMDDGTVYLKFGLSLTDLIGLYSVSAGEGASLQTVQTPETSGTDDQGTIKLAPGEVMVITGLSRRIARSSRNGLAEEVPVALGGSKTRGYRREDFVIVVRATPI